MAGLCEGGNEPSGSLKAIAFENIPQFLVLSYKRKRNIVFNFCNFQCSCEQHQIKINANKTKTMVIGRKVMEVNLPFSNETVEQRNSFKYSGCTISSNMSCCQEVKRRITMAKEAFNRKRKSLVRCFVWSVALYGSETWTLRRSEEKRIEAFEMWIWRRMEHEKWTDRVRNEAVLKRVHEERMMMLKLIRKRKRNWLGHWLRRNCLLKVALEGMVNGRRVRGRRRYQVVDDIKIQGHHFIFTNIFNINLPIPLDQRRLLLPSTTGVR
ncbi:hypothetical protein ANN_07612 [Periplaneta americana]|uniref:Uncharacterized protein n=1 Tax=Periplaneta americana TaxID=6978 RepID=A0ABQ8T0G6_PERAM|nr:hypothetical protein ANN_07612 [Periplaneta americana]